MQRQADSRLVDISEIEALHFCIGELHSFFKYAALDYHIKSANEGARDYDIIQANERAIIMIKMWDYLDKMDAKRIETIILEIDGLIASQSVRKEKKSDYKAVRTIIEDYLSIEKWAS